MATAQQSTSSNKAVRGLPSSCVFVASLAAVLSDDQLCLSVTEKFKEFGELSGVKVLGIKRIGHMLLSNSLTTWMLVEHLIWLTVRC